jgi:hypothetical protein
LEWPIKPHKQYVNRLVPMELKKLILLVSL